eukprot:GEMP01040072.1.p4 GENE.GEMP01040072.1~~GEMP01040072.1.p4  ORF type:complete len:154 (+),score=36.04 GEMP01040072.1:66-527(+)
MRGLYDWQKNIEVEELPERLDHYSNYGSRPPTREGGRRNRSSCGDPPRVGECEWTDEPQEILLEDCFRSRENIDRAMMIEAASRHLLRRDDSGAINRVGTPFRRKNEQNELVFGCGEDSEEKEYKNMKRPPSRKKTLLNRRSPDWVCLHPQYW